MTTLRPSPSTGASVGARAAGGNQETGAVSGGRRRRKILLCSLQSKFHKRHVGFKCCHIEAVLSNSFQIKSVGKYVLEYCNVVTKLFANKDCFGEIFLDLLIL